MNWEAAREYLIGRLAEKTTWAGLFAFAITFGGFAIAPGYVEQIAVAGSALTSLLLVLLKEKGSAK